MRKSDDKNTRHILPYLALSSVVGFLTAILGSAFKLGAQWAVHFSATVYDTVGQNPLWMPALVLGAAGLGLAASFIVAQAKSCKGGGIPTSIAAVRGIVRFNWVSGVLALPFSALITFLGGLPLGTEGPCVQMGTAIGEGAVTCLGSPKHRGWRRYIMTGGASAGFSVATASPISAILFAVEELHKAFSPLLLSGVSICVMTAQITVQLLGLLGIESEKLFHLPQMAVLGTKLLFIPVLVGAVCGLCSVGFTSFYHVVEKRIRGVLEKRSLKAVFPVLFAGIALVGLCVSDALGTGHGLVDKLLTTRMAWYLLALVFLLRAVLMMVSNTAGVTGGIFLPTLAFGAMIGSLCGDGLTALGWIEPQYRILMVVLGITAFLGATSRIPLTACVFAVEALNGMDNALAIVIAVTVAFLIAKLSGVEDLTDTVIEAKAHALSRGKQPEVTVVSLTVGEESFVAGKEPGDILWPHGCVVTAVARGQAVRRGEEIRPGDVLTLRCTTHDPAVMAEELDDLFGAACQAVGMPDV